MSKTEIINFLASPEQKADYDRLRDHIKPVSLSALIRDKLDREVKKMDREKSVKDD